MLNSCWNSFFFLPYLTLVLIILFQDRVLIKNGDLVLENVSSEDDGVYTCRISNFAKSETGSVKVTVEDESKFTSVDEDEILEVDPR